MASNARMVWQWHLMKTRQARNRLVCAATRGVANQRIVSSLIYRIAYNIASTA